MSPLRFIHYESTDDNDKPHNYADEDRNALNQTVDNQIPGHDNKKNNKERQTREIIALNEHENVFKMCTNTSQRAIEVFLISA